MDFELKTMIFVLKPMDSRANLDTLEVSFARLPELSERFVSSCEFL